MNFLRGFSLNAMSTGLVFALGLVNQWFLSDRLEPGPYGSLALWTTAAMFGALLFGEWLNKGNAYVVGKTRRRDKSLANTLIYVLGLAMLLLLVAGAEPSLPILPATTQLHWFLLAGLIALGAAQKAFQAIALGEDRIKLYSLVPVIFIAAYLLGNILVLQRWNLGLDGVLQAWLLAVALAVLVAFLPLLGKGFSPRGDGAVFAQTLGVGGRGAVSVILVFLLFRIDYYLVDYFMLEADVGTYRVSNIFADMMQRLPNIAGLVLLPKVIRGEDRDAGLSLKVARVMLLFSLLAALGILFLGEPLIAIFFHKYPGAYAPLVWLLPGLVLTGFASVFNTKLAGEGYPPITLWAPALALAVNVALNLILIQDMGLRGAALSKSIAYGLWSLIISVHYLRRTGHNWSTFLRWR